jgi:hypothetical protein
MNHDQEAFASALLAWLQSQEVSFNISIPVMIGLCGTAIGESAADRDQLLRAIELHEKLLVTTATNAYKDTKQ